MKNGMLVGVVLIGLLACFIATPAVAVGFGIFGELEAGDGDFEFDFSDEFDVDVDVFSVGLAFDTDPLGEKVFNYRLNVGYSRLELEDDYSDTLELDGFIVDNTFCFAMVRSPNMRVWLGPQVRVGYYSGESDTSYYVDDFDAGDDIDVELVTFGLAGVVGANFRMGYSGAFGISGGVRFSGYAGEAEFLGHDEDLEGDATTFFITATALF